jgi:hypothetical protein
LAIELSLFVHESTYKKVKFLKKNASESFLAWICPLLKPSIFDEQEYVYFDGDEINCIYFAKQGELGFVLAAHSNLKYIDISNGNYFGVIDMVGSMLNGTGQSLHLNKHTGRMNRQFTI